MGEQAEQAEALWYVSPGRVEIRAETIGPPAAGEVRLRALYGGISRGTERLVLNGRIPVSEHSRMRAPNMAGDFPFPVKYGYATVGRIESGPADLVGRIGFALYPHQSAFNLPVDAVALLPDDVPASRGVLAANMETALNAVWDAAPGPADRIAIVGAGWWARCARGCAPSCPARTSRWSTSIRGRAEIAAALGVGLRAALRCRRRLRRRHPCERHRGRAGDGAASCRRRGRRRRVELVRVRTQIAVSLGEAFHSRRLRLISSQVGQVAPSHRPRWSHGRRLAAALGLLGDAALDALIATPIDFHDLPIAAAENPRRARQCAMSADPLSRRQGMIPKSCRLFGQDHAHDHKA